MDSNGFLRVSLSPDSHASLAFSCADKLVWHFADQILQQQEVAIAYPCLNCRGGLSLFLAYLAIAIEENPAGRPLDPLLIYPGTVEIRQAYTGLKVQVGELLDALRQRRVRARRECFVHRWEENVLRSLRRGRFDKTAVFPLHDFFPAAVLDEDGWPHIFAGRHGFGRGDEARPPLQFATKIMRVSPGIPYRATVIVHDAVDSRAERQRLSEHTGRIRTGSLIHLFESPYSPTFRRMMVAGKRYWRLRPEDFNSEDTPVPPDDEVKRMLEAQRRVHSVPFPLSMVEYRTLTGNLGQLRQSARERPEIAEAYTYLYNCYRLIATLPVPVDHYDAVADQFGLSTASERIDDVKETAGVLGPGVAYSLIDESVQALRSLLDRVEADPARARAMLAEVRRASREGKRLGIVVSSPVFASAIERFLADELECETLSLPDKYIYMVEARSLPYLEPFDILLFSGYRGPVVLRWMMSGRAKEIVAILSEPERKALGRDLRAGTQGRDSWKPRPEVRAGEAESVTVGPADMESTSVREFEKALGQPAPELPDLPLDDDEFIRDILDYPPPVGSSSGGSASVSAVRACRRVMFTNRYAYLPADGTITVLVRGGTAEKRVEDLTIADVVLFVNGDQRRSIYELMLAEIKKSPAFAVSAGIIEAWHRRLKAEFARSFMTIADLHRKLRAAGSSVVSATVGGWLRGSVMSPQDSENLRRLFGVLNIPDPEGKHSGRVDGAARHLRNVYRQYAKAVNAFLLRAAGDDRPELDVLLEKYNLDIDAIREAVVAEEVEEISSDTAEIPASRTGRLHDR